VLPLLVVQALAAFGLVATIAGFLLGQARTFQSSRGLRVVAKRDPARWTEVVWLGGSMIAVLWPIGVLLIPAYAYHWPTFSDFADSWVIQVLGFLISLAGGILFFAAARALGRHMTPEIQVQEGHQLVQEGPYRYIRHPVYTAIITASAGQTILYLSPILGAIVLFLAGIAIYRAVLEEKLLSSPEAFGKLYTDYVARTGRFLPRIRSRP
jgi:protein-S-isoprenylcysteine O-methyltransferase Ste14